MRNKTVSSRFGEGGWLGWSSLHSQHHLGGRIIYWPGFTPSHVRKGHSTLVRMRIMRNKTLSMSGGSTRFSTTAEARLRPRTTLLLVSLLTSLTMLLLKTDSKTPSRSEGQTNTR